MKQIMLAAVACLSVLSALEGQVNCTLENGREIIVHSDKTWEFADDAKKVKENPELNTPVGDCSKYVETIED